MTHLPVSSCGMERELSADLGQAAGRSEGGSSHQRGLLLCFKNPHGSGTAFLWAEVALGTSG